MYHKPENKDKQKFIQIVLLKYFNLTKWWHLRVYSIQKIDGY